MLNKNLGIAKAFQLSEHSNYASSNYANTTVYSFAVKKANFVNAQSGIRTEQERAAEPHEIGRLQEAVPENSARKLPIPGQVYRRSTRDRGEQIE